MAGTDCLLAIGSQNHVSLVDSRVKAFVSSFANAEHNHGEQGVAFKRPLPLYLVCLIKYAFAHWRRTCSCPKGGGEDTRCLSDT